MWYARLGEDWAEGQWCGGGAVLGKGVANSVGHGCSDETSAARSLMPRYSHISHMMVFTLFIA